MSKSDDRCVIRDELSSIGSLYGISNCAAFATLISITSLALAIGLYWVRSKDHRPQNVTKPPFVPFVVLHDSLSSQYGNHPKSIHQVLRTILEDYQKEGSQALAALSSMLDEAFISEMAMQPTTNNKKLLSAKINRRIQSTAQGLEHDEKVLKGLLGNFRYILALPDKDAIEKVDTSNPQSIKANEKSKNFRMHGARPTTVNASDTHSYDSANQIFAHLVRDWTKEGKLIRETLYTWCVEQMKVFCDAQSTVLVPGSGMGRLAYELSQLGHRVEANELSPSMAAAAQAILNHQMNGIFHPYLLDPMANEVDSSRRFVKVNFPDTPILASSLSYTIGNFVADEDDYYHRDRVGHFDAIVTCFFIDTATNIYEYLQTIHKLLRPKNGIWINVGPVQWHHNALLRPSVDELKDMIEAFGWTLKKWSIDIQPISYRDHTSHQDNKKLPPPTTSYDGYRPLRFVAVRSN